MPAAGNRERRESPCRYRRELLAKVAEAQATLSRPTEQKLLYRAYHE